MKDIIEARMLSGNQMQNMLRAVGDMFRYQKQGLTAEASLEMSKLVMLTGQVADAMGDPGVARVLKKTSADMKRRVDANRRSTQN